MQKNGFILLIFIAIIMVISSALADDSLPFIIGEPIIDGNGCPEGTHDNILHPHDHTIFILFSNFYIETREDRTYDRANCLILINNPLSFIAWSECEGKSTVLEISTTLFVSKPADRPDLSSYISLEEIIIDPASWSWRYCSDFNQDKALKII